MLTMSFHATRVSLPRVTPIPHSTPQSLCLLVYLVRNGEGVVALVASFTHTGACVCTHKFVRDVEVYEAACPLPDVTYTCYGDDGETCCLFATFVSPLSS